MTEVQIRTFLKSCFAVLLFGSRSLESKFNFSLNLLNLLTTDTSIVHSDIILLRVILLETVNKTSYDHIGNYTITVSNDIASTSEEFRFEVESKCKRR